ncbi:uncharacterized protein LOC100902832 [Galendromus occidentalis]|uniref:Uncharacterized protein LOC100902832 n=1 Tax=Galendromus occidentalis TaxID=34638 RepID=A0AAJ6QRA9_9ACAR|nr:uncharacterized protein LOC100902832 [Galendromus occidentalis]
MATMTAMLPNEISSYVRACDDGVEVDLDPVADGDVYAEDSQLDASDPRCRGDEYGLDYGDTTTRGYEGGYQEGSPLEANSISAPEQTLPDENIPPTVNTFVPENGTDAYPSQTTPSLTDADIQYCPDTNQPIYFDRAANQWFYVDPAFQVDGTSYGQAEDPSAAEAHDQYNTQVERTEAIPDDGSEVLCAPDGHTPETGTDDVPVETGAEQQYYDGPGDSISNVNQTEDQVCQYPAEQAHVTEEQIYVTDQESHEVSSRLISPGTDTLSNAGSACLQVVGCANGEPASVEAYEGQEIPYAASDAEYSAEQEFAQSSEPIDESVAPVDGYSEVEHQSDLDQVFFGTRAPESLAHRSCSQIHPEATSGCTDQTSTSFATGETNHLGEAHPEEAAPDYEVQDVVSDPATYPDMTQQYQEEYAIEQEQYHNGGYPVVAAASEEYAQEYYDSEGHVAQSVVAEEGGQALDPTAYEAELQEGLAPEQFPIEGHQLDPGAELAAQGYVDGTYTNLEQAYAEQYDGGQNTVAGQQTYDTGAEYYSYEQGVGENVVAGEASAAATDEAYYSNGTFEEQDASGVHYEEVPTVPSTDAVYYAESAQGTYDADGVQASDSTHNKAGDALAIPDGDAEPPAEAALYESDNAYVDGTEAPFSDQGYVSEQTIGSTECDYGSQALDVVQDSQHQAEFIAEYSQTDERPLDGLTDGEQYSEVVTEPNAETLGQYPQEYVHEAPQEYVYESLREYVPGSPQEYAQEAPQEYMQEAPQEYVQEASQEYAYEAAAEYASEASQEYAYEAPQEYAYEAPQEYAYGAAAEYVQEAPRKYAYEVPAEKAYEAPQEYVHETPQEYVHEATQEYVHEATQEYVHGATQEYVHGAPQEYVHEALQGDVGHHPGEYAQEQVQEYAGRDSQHIPEGSTQENVAHHAEDQTASALNGSAYALEYDELENKPILDSVEENLTTSIKRAANIVKGKPFTLEMDSTEKFKSFRLEYERTPAFESFGYCLKFLGIRRGFVCSIRPDGVVSVQLKGKQHDEWFNTEFEYDSSKPAGKIEIGHMYIIEHLYNGCIYLERCRVKHVRGTEALIYLLDNGCERLISINKLYDILNLQDVERLPPQVVEIHVVGLTNEGYSEEDLERLERDWNAYEEVYIIPVDAPKDGLMHSAPIPGDSDNANSSKTDDVSDELLERSYERRKRSGSTPKQKLLRGWCKDITTSRGNECQDFDDDLESSYDDLNGSVTPSENLDIIYSQHGFKRIKLVNYEADGHLIVQVLEYSFKLFEMARFQYDEARPAQGLRPHRYYFAKVPLSDGGHYGNRALYQAESEFESHVTMWFPDTWMKVPVPRANIYEIENYDDAAKLPHQAVKVSVAGVTNMGYSEEQLQESLGGWVTSDDSFFMIRAKPSRKDKHVERSTGVPRVLIMDGQGRVLGVWKRSHSEKREAGSPASPTRPAATREVRVASEG